MSKQRSLTSFFKPVQTKRLSTDSPLDVNSKKLKLGTCDETAVNNDTERNQVLEVTKPISSGGLQKGVLDALDEEKAIAKNTGKAEYDESNAQSNGKQVKESEISDETNYSQQSTQEVRNASVIGEEPEEEATYSQRSTQPARDYSVDEPNEEATYSERSTQPACDYSADDTEPSEEATYSQRSTQPVRDNGTDDTEVLKDVTKEDNNHSNFTTPVKSEAKFISTPLGMLSPLQCLAKIKSQCAKTPALHHSIGSSWFFALQGEFSKPYFNELSKFLVTERKKAVIYPPEEQVWTWTQLCAMKDVKVVILGQDPYHNPGQAHGLCFSVQKGVPPPPSLLNMYKELESDIPGFKAPKHGNLTGWAQQGVLLLNACLTVRANCPNSHKERGWEQLTDAVIKRLSDMSSGIVFLLWGSYAHKKGGVVNKKKHHILQTAHPSPLSAHRGFLGSKHFSKCNDLLKKGGKKPIDWAHLPLL